MHEETGIDFLYVERITVLSNYQIGFVYKPPKGYDKFFIVELIFPVAFEIRKADGNNLPTWIPLIRIGKDYPMALNLDDVLFIESPNMRQVRTGFNIQ